MEQLTLHEKFGPNYVLLELEGSINAYTLFELKEKLYQYIMDANVVLDLSLVSTIDMAGMGVIMAACNDGTDSGTKVFIMNPSEGAKTAIEKTGFEDTFYLIHAVTEVSDAS